MSITTLSSVSAGARGTEKLKIGISRRARKPKHGIPATCWSKNNRSINSSAAEKDAAEGAAAMLLPGRHGTVETLENCNTFTGPVRCAVCDTQGAGSARAPADHDCRLSLRCDVSNLLLHLHLHLSGVSGVVQGTSRKSTSAQTTAAAAYIRQPIGLIKHLSALGSVNFSDLWSSFETSAN
jgi:hypothetical protein